VLLIKNRNRTKDPIGRISPDSRVDLCSVWHYQSCRMLLLATGVSFAIILACRHVHNLLIYPIHILQQLEGD
jgi:hypothetical protein